LPYSTPAYPLGGSYLEEVTASDAFGVLKRVSGYRAIGDSKSWEIEFTVLTQKLSLEGLCSLSGVLTTHCLVSNLLAATFYGASGVLGRHLLKTRMAFEARACALCDAPKTSVYREKTEGILKVVYRAT